MDREMEYIRHAPAQTEPRSAILGRRRSAKDADTTIEYLRLQEKSEYHYKRLASAVYALRYLGYVRRKITDKDMRQWLSEHLNIDYTLRNTSSQYMRAWRENSRYARFVQDHVQLLANYGINHFASPEEE